MFTTLPFIVCLFWLVFLLLEWKRSSHAQHMLTLFAAACASLYLCHALYFEGFYAISRYADTIYAFCNIAVFPIYYLYICRLTQVGKISPRQWALLLPAIIIGIWTAIDFFIFPGNEALDSWRISVAKTIFVVQLGLVTYYGWRRIGAFDRRIMDFYSNIENRTANMTSHIIFILSACALVSVVFSYIGREYFVGQSLALYLPSSIFSVCLYAVFYIGYRQTFTADDLANDEDMAYATTAATAIAPQRDDDAIDKERVAADQSPAQAFEDFDRVCRMIEDNQWYLRPDLRLPDLALLVGIGRTRLSNLINENSGMSFSDFINKYRIQYACQLLKENALDKDLVLSAIGVQCGFMSESPFYRNFKKFTGTTPAQYREK